MLPTQHPVKWQKQANPVRANNSSRVIRLSLGLAALAGLVMAIPAFFILARHKPRQRASRQAYSLASLPQHSLQSRSQYVPELTCPQAALGATPCVAIAIKNPHWLSADFEGSIPNCTYQDQPLRCIFRPSINTPDPEADALWFHIPTSGPARKDAPHQVTVGFSMESSVYYGNLNDRVYMDSFDIEMSYRQCAHVVTPFGPDNMRDIGTKLFADPVPFEDKLDAIVYINSNCRTRNGRNDVVASMMRLKQVEVHAWGRCLRNRNEPRTFDKMKVLRQYKFCIAMENSNAPDYVSEKIWHAFEAGCVPIYWGAPNILDYVPTANSFIDWGKYDGDVIKLVNDVNQLMRNKTAYMEMLAWKHTPSSQVPGFRRYLTQPKPVHTQCKLCQAVYHQRHGLANFTHTHCMRNQTWLTATNRHQAGQVVHTPANSTG